MKKLLALCLLASAAFAESPEFGAIRLEVTPATKHAFVSAKPESTDATVISTNEWNAAHTTPTYSVCGSAPLVWDTQPSSLTELAATTSQRCRINLSNAASVRVVVPVTVAGAATAVIRAQYTTDTTCASGWAYLDGSAGPSVSISSTGVKTSAIVTLATAAVADVCIRYIGLVP